MTDHEWAYFAGILDGEGYIGLPRNRAMVGKSPRARVQVDSTDSELIEWLVLRFGGYVGQKKLYEAHHRPAQVWRITGPRAIAALRGALPYMVIERKRERARILTDEYDPAIVRNGRYTVEQAARLDEIVERFRSLSVGRCG